LVIGGTGLLGQALLRAGDGSRQVAATHHTTPRHGAGWFQLDLTDPSATQDLIRRLRPRSIINAAYVQRGPNLESVTAQAPGVIASAAAEIGARYVHLSSDTVFDGTDKAPYNEACPPNPINDYGNAKLRAEKLVARNCPGAVIVRTSLLWRASVDGGPQVDLVRDPSMTFFNDEIRNPLNVDVLASACLELVDRTDIVGVLHVAGSDAVDRLTFAQHLAAVVGIDPNRLKGAPGGAVAGRAQNCSLDSSRAKRLLATALPGILSPR